MGAETCLWTGFEPFGDHDSNLSAEVARAAAARGGTLEGASHDYRVLPVTVEAAREFAEETVADGDVEYVIQLGLAESRSAISLERRARNRRGCRPDEAGVAPDAVQPLVDGAPDRFEAELDVDRLCERLAARVDKVGPPHSRLPPIRPSDDAGDFVCNALYFHSLRRAHSTSGAPRILFIHVPSMSERKARGLGRLLAEVAVDEAGV